MILLIDNYDSFTYNLYQYVGIFNPDIKVVRNDKITIEEIEKMDVDRIIAHDGTSVFTGIDSPIKVARYHSLAVQEADLPECLRVLARTEDGEIMAMRHKEYPVVGLQFHPESIYTEHGKRIIENFVNDTI